MGQFRNLRSLIVIILVFVCISMTTSLSQEAQSDEHDVILFVDEGSLTVYNNAEGAISLEKFQLSVVVGEGDIFITELAFRFDLESTNFLILPGTCLIYKYDADATPPEDCNPNLVQESVVQAEVDRFWMDDEGERRTITILRDLLSIREVCPNDQYECPIFYSRENPDVLTLEEVVDQEPPERLIPEPRNILPFLKLESNKGPVTAVAWSPSDNLLMSGHNNGEICLWAVAEDMTGGVNINNEQCEQAHELAVKTLHWKPFADADSDNTDLWLASGSENGQLEVWQIVQADDTYTLQQTMIDTTTHTGLKNVVWHPSQNRLMVVKDDGISIIDVDVATPAFNRVRTLLVNKPTVAYWRRDGRFIATITEVGFASILDSTEEYQHVTLGTDFGLGMDILWNPIFDTIVTADSDNHVRLYDYVPVCSENRCTYDTISLNLASISDLELSRDNTHIAIGLQRAIHVIEAHDPYRLIAVYNLENADSDIQLMDVTWSPDDSKLIAGDSLGNLYVWDAQVEDTKRIEKITTFKVTDHSRSVGMAWNQNGTHVAVVDQDRYLSIWNTDTETPLDSSSAHTGTPISIDWNENTNMLATGGCGPMVNIWQQDSVDELGSLSNTVFCASSLDFRPVEDEFPILAIADENGTLRLWNVDERSELEVQQWEGSVFTDIEWNSTGEYIATTNTAGILRVVDVVETNGNYDLQDRYISQPATGFSLNTVAWSLDDRQIATGSGSGRITILSPSEDGTELEKQYELWRHDGAVESISWSRDNNLLVSVGNDNRLILWDSRTAQILAEEILDAPPIEVKWSPSDSRFAVLDQLGNLTIWQFLG